MGDGGGETNWLYERQLSHVQKLFHATHTVQCKGGYTLVTLPRIVTPYCDSVDGTRDRVAYQKLVTR